MRKSLSKDVQPSVCALRFVSIFGFREATIADAEMLAVWLRDHVAGEVDGPIEPMIERLEGRCRELAIEPPAPHRVRRIARSALHAHEDRFHESVYERLPSATRARLDALLRPKWIVGGSKDAEPAVLLKLLGGPGRPSLASMRDELGKLELIRAIDLSPGLFEHSSPGDI